MTYNKDLKPKGAGDVLYSSADFKNIQAEIDTLKSAVGVLQNKLADMADLVETGTLKATDAVQTDQLSANLAVLGTAVVENELAVSNGSGNDKDVIVNRNGVPEWGPPTDINAKDVLVCDTVARATTVDHTGTVNEAESVTNVDQCETVGEAQTVSQGDTVTHADVVTEVDTIGQVDTVSNATTVTNATAVTNADTVTGADTVNHADVVKDAQTTEIQHDFDIQGDLAVSGSISQAGSTLDATYIQLAEKGVADGVATLDSTGRIPASQLTIDAMEYKGKWNASTNTPALADGTGTDGDFYIVSVAGTQDLGSGSIDFYVNDRVLYNGSEWERVPAGQVDSVNGSTGDVVLTGEDIAESTSDSLTIDRRLKNWLFVDGQGANATKTARGYFSADGIALITFDTNNVYQDAFSLTINGVTCQVYLNGAPTSSTNYTLPKGTYIVKTGILGLTPYYIIDTDYCVFSAREAGHATSADSATTATSATGADYAYLSFNKLYTCSTSASTTSKSITLPLTANDLANNPIEFMCKFVYGNTNSNARLLINGTTFDYAINGAVRSASNYKWDAGTYRITLVGGRAYINPYSPQRLGGLSDVTSSVTTSAGYTADKNGFLWGTITAASANDAIFFLSITHDGTAIPVDVLRWRISKNLYNSFCIPVSVGDVVKIDTATNIYQQKFYMQAWG